MNRSIIEVQYAARVSNKIINTCTQSHINAQPSSAESQDIHNRVFTDNHIVSDFVI